MPDPHSFKSTRWSIIARAAGIGEHADIQALHDLCNAYFAPLQAYAERICRRYRDLIEADELLSDFFLAKILNGYVMERVIEAREQNRADSASRFRNFLRVCLKRFLLSAIRNRIRARNRDAIEEFVDDDQLVSHVDESEASRSYNHAWAITTYDRALKAFRSQLRSDNLEDTFEPFCDYMQRQHSLSKTLSRVGRSDSPEDRNWGRRHARHFRAGIKACIRREIADTLMESSVTAIDEEVKLFNRLISEIASRPENDS